MPLYEYTCEGCHGDFELLVRDREQPACPECGGVRLQKRLSVPAAPAISGASLPMCEPRPSSGGCGLPQCGSGGCMGMM
ncbi:MAG: zinc ribbon domain-containing protein [Pirellulaceae bacterium]|nr:zinc ribbon domain-containing protein [Planctomycetales bacterium]MCA9220149.1 zinc ribbon domain-containing protein [Planctomycetales bacterium]